MIQRTIIVVVWKAAIHASSVGAMRRGWLVKRVERCKEEENTLD